MSSRILSAIDKLDFPDVYPSLNLDFANTKSLDPRIDFDRSSTATYYDGETFAKAEENLFKYSQEIETANGWDERSIINVSTTKVAPDGTNTATEYEVEDVSDFHKLNPPLDSNIAANTTVTISAFFKVTGNQQYILFRARASSNAFQVFDVQNGTVSNGNGNVDNASINDVGNGWHRCAMTTTMSSDIFSIVFYPHNSDNDNEDSYLGDSSNGFLIWGAQLEQRDQVTAYTPTTDQPITNYIPVLQTASSDEPRFDHDPVTGESKGLLIEEQRTNLLDYSEDFASDWNDFYNTDIRAGAITSPDGLTNGTKLYAFDNNSQSYRALYYGFTWDPNKIYTFSIYAKADTVSYLKFSTQSYVDDNIMPVAEFTLNGTSSQGTQSGVFEVKVEFVGNGWHRCSATFSGADTTNNYLSIGFNANSDLGEFTTSAFIWGAQLEEGSFPTSYIKTDGSQVTRTADSASITGENFSEWYRQDEGTLYAEAVGQAVDSTIFAFDAGAESDQIHIGFDDNAIRTYCLARDAVQSVLSTSYDGTLIKVAATHSRNDVVFTAGSTTPQVDTSQEMPRVTQAGIGRRAYRDGFTMTGTIKKLAYYPNRLPNSQLIQLTEK